MAKIKVHELAKELDIKSRDILSFLQEKGVEVKAAQSSIEGEAVEWVKRRFSGGPDKTEERKTVSVAAETVTEKEPLKTAEKPRKAEESGTASRESGADRAKEGKTAQNRAAAPNGGDARPAAGAKEQSAVGESARGTAKEGVRMASGEGEGARTAQSGDQGSAPVRGSQNATGSVSGAAGKPAQSADRRSAQGAAGKSGQGAAGKTAQGADRRPVQGAAGKPAQGAAGRDAQGRPVKKARTIIVLNNPQNSRMKNQGAGNPVRRDGQNRPAPGRGNDGRGSGPVRSGDGRGDSRSGSRQGGYPGQNRGANTVRTENRPLIRPLTKPSQPVMPDETLLRMERAAKEAEQKAAAAAQRAAREAEIEAQRKADNEARLERIERAERTEGLAGPSAQAERVGQDGRAERIDSAARDGQNGRTDAAERIGQDGRMARADRAERAGVGQPERTDRAGRAERPERGERSDRMGRDAASGGYRGDRQPGQYGQGRDQRQGDRGRDRVRDAARGDQRYGGAGRSDQRTGERTGGFARSDGRRDDRGGMRAGQERMQGNGPRREQGQQNRPGFNGGARDNQGYNRGTGSARPGAGGGRPGQNSGRPQSGDGRTDNRFRKSAPSKGFAPEPPAKDTEKRRDDRRLSQQERDKKSRRDAIYEDDSAARLKGRNKAGRFIKPEVRPAEPEEAIKVITIPETITIKDLADKMKLQPAAIVKKLFLEGKIVTVNQEISFEDAESIAIEHDIICEKEVKVDVIEELLKEDEEREEDMITRPPVICVMGHVDHGKTSLLDAIRKTNVTDKEAGGITQHIGAYTVQINGQSITFLDTPGHEAFTAMRMRGANSTDIAVLVVAADDGVMPQTVEAINHAKAAGIEIIVAVNKIDKPNANVDRVKQELTEYGLVAEDWGGSTVFAPVSAKTGEGLQNLLEMILLTAEVLELKANPNRRARGIVIEAELDKGRGPVARVLVQKGTLRVGDFVSAGSSSGKVRAMIDDKGKRVKEATPSTPVEILGLSDVPDAGDVFLAHESDKEAKSYAAAFIDQNKEKKLEETKSRMSLDDLFNQIREGNLKELNLIVKADVQGSVEAVKQSLTKLSNEEVVVKCIHGGVGAINESDVTLASASNAIIIGFNVRPDATAKATAEAENVDIRLYRVIYQAIEDIEAAMKGMLDPIYEEKVIGHAEVRQIFRASNIGNIAGAYVLDGVFQRGCRIRISREGTQIYEGSLASLKRFKDDVKEVRAGFECGLVFEGFDKMQELDIIEAYVMVEVPR